MVFASLDLKTVIVFSQIEKIGFSEALNSFLSVQCVLDLPFRRLSPPHTSEALNQTKLRLFCTRRGGSAFPVSYASRIMQKQYFLPSSTLTGARLVGSHGDTQEPKTNPLVSISDEPETLYKRLSILVKGHDKAVLDSYEYFAVLAAKELGISVEKVDKPPKMIERFTLLKSVHIYKKHRVQYEMRTHYLCLELKYLTSSTAAVYLEYVQRNLPEGVAMEVKKTKIEKIPEHIQKPVWDTLPQVEETEVKS